ncbi:tetratricopeptide repeat protein [Nonomuraea sp. CA-143628]|uniref:tetratricopeptide repeat protein n=1 Tax=Nonomuraea sp. CA-143628 TaxID=3239997 RepID=UPI003D8C9576
MNATDLITRADELAETEEYAEAAALYGQAAQGGLPEAAVYQGEMLFHLGDYPAAERVLRAALAGGQTDAYGWLSDTLVAAERPAEAAMLMEQAAGQGHPVAALRAATIWADAVGDRERAEQWYLKAIDRGDRGALNDYGTFLAEDDSRLEEAEHVLRQAAEQGDALAFSNLGEMELDRDAPEAAAEWLRRGLELEDQSGSTALLKLADAEARLGNLDEARALHDRAVDAGLPDAHVARANFLADHDDPEAAEADFLAAVEAGDEGAHYYYAEFLAAHDRVGPAVEHYDQAVEDGSDAAHQRLAFIYLGNGAVRAAEEHFKESIAAGWLSSVYSYADMLRQEGRADEIAALLPAAERLGATPDQLEELTAV